MSDAFSKLWVETLKRTGASDDFDLDRILNEPVDPELLALAQEAVEAMDRDKVYLASLSPEERERVEKERIEKMAKAMVETPFYEAELLGICKAEDVK